MREIKLRDRYSGNPIWIVVRDGMVTGAMGCEPARYIGLTESDARHYARTGRLPRKACGASDNRDDAPPGDWRCTAPAGHAGNHSNDGLEWPRVDPTATARQSRV